MIMSIQVLASVKKGKPELRKKVQLCQQCLIYISIYLMLLQHCFYTCEELNNIALSIYIIYINIFLLADNLIYSLPHLYARWCPLWSSDRGRPSEERTASSSTLRTMQVGNCGIFLKRAVNLVFDHCDKSLILNINHCSGVIVNNKGEMKGSAITGEKTHFKNQDKQDLSKISQL